MREEGGGFLRRGERLLRILLFGRAVTGSPSTIFSEGGVRVSISWLNFYLFFLHC